MPPKAAATAKPAPRAKPPVAPSKASKTILPPKTKPNLSGPVKPAAGAATAKKSVAPAPAGKAKSAPANSNQRAKGLSTASAVVRGPVPPAPPPNLGQAYESATPERIYPVKGERVLRFGEIALANSLKDMGEQIAARTKSIQDTAKRPVDGVSADPELIQRAIDHLRIGMILAIRAVTKPTSFC